MRYICTSIVATLVLAGTSFAATINVPGDQPTIAAAISASVNGDVISIAAGTYNEYGLSTNGKAVTIQGMVNGDGSLATTIDAQQGSNVFFINSGEGAGTVIKDLVITGGAGNSAGGGIYCSQSNPTITNCTISGNASGGGGGGIYCSQSNPTITNCTISGNTANSSGGGIWCINDSIPTITGCTITANTATNGGGIYCSSNGDPTIKDCVISSNTANDDGGGVYCGSSSSPMFDACTITTNNVTGLGGGIYCDSTSSPTLSSGSVCGNNPSQTFNEPGGVINSSLCWIGASCQGNPFTSIGELQTQVAALQATQAQQQTAIEELQAIVTACCTEKSCAGDTNGDGVIDIEDLLNMLGNWGPCP